MLQISKDKWCVHSMLINVPNRRIINLFGFYLAFSAWIKSTLTVKFDCKRSKYMRARFSAVLSSSCPLSDSKSTLCHWPAKGLMRQNVLSVPSAQSHNISSVLWIKSIKSSDCLLLDVVTLIFHCSTEICTLHHISLQRGVNPRVRYSISAQWTCDVGSIL